MSHTISASYERNQNVSAVIQELKKAGFSDDQISLIANDAEGTYKRQIDHDHHDNDDVSAGEGAGFGALAGTVVGLAAAVLPGIGGVIAAGPFAGALIAGVGAASGAATGGIVGALTDSGVSEDDAHVHAEIVRRGGAIVLVNTNTEDETRTAEAILNKHQPVDLAGRREELRKDNWRHFDEEGEPYVRDNATERRYS